MSNLEAVNFSLHGDAQLVGAKRPGKDISGLVQFDPKNPPKDDKEWVIFKLVNNSTKGGVYLSSVDDVVNPATGRVERIRLLAGVDTIWQKEQKDITVEYARKNLREIKFPRGIKIRRVNKSDATMLDFLRITNANVGNISRIGGGRFEIYEYDTAAADKEAFEREELEYKMESVAREAKVADMKKHASFLGIRLITDLGEVKSEDGIRREYARYAKSNPLYFKQTLGDTEYLEVSWLVKKAVGETLIEIGREPGKIYWANGGGMIGVYAQGDDPQKYLVDLAMTNSKEGKTFKEQLKKVAT